MTASFSFEARLEFSNPCYICHCSECKETFTVQYREPRATDALPPATCPLCSSELIHVTEESVNMDIFDYLALDFNLSRETVEGIYDLWSPASGDAIRFVDFLRQAIDGKVE